MDIIEVIKKRRSSRTFNQEVLKPTDKKVLEDFMHQNNKGLDMEIQDFIIVEKKSENKKMKLDYGMIKGHNTYILGKSKSTLLSRVNYGYLMEKVVLKATEINVSSCWIGIFDNAYFQELTIENGFEIPGIVIIGYSEEYLSIQDRFVRFTISSAKRLSWEKLFFNYTSKIPLTPDSVKGYSDSLEMVRLAPSAGNTQPWRILFDNVANEYHFYKKPINKRYESIGLHDIDLGIALAHFELTSLNNGLSGNWIDNSKKNIDIIDEMQYVMTWKCK
jgi:nitroreductase